MSSSSKTYEFNIYNLELSQETKDDTVVLSGKLEGKTENSSVTLVEHHVKSRMDQVLELTQDGHFSARLRKSDDYVLRFLTDDETFSIPITE